MVGHIYRRPPRFRIHFAIPAPAFFRVKPRAISTLHIWKAFSNKKNATSIAEKSEKMDVACRSASSPSSDRFPTPIGSHRPSIMLTPLLASITRLPYTRLPVAVQASDGKFPQVSIYAENIIVRTMLAKYQVPIAPDEKPILSLAFRRDNRWAVWDDRGLTVRVGNDVTSYDLAEIAVSPRIFTRDEILKTVAERRNTRATALAGARRLGTKTYFVPRWLDAKGVAWLEALVEIDLTLPKPKPKLLARIPGLSFAAKPIERQLEANADELWVLIQQTTPADGAKTGALRSLGGIARWSYSLKSGSPGVSELVPNAGGVRLWSTSTDRWIAGKRAGRYFAARLHSDGHVTTFAESREPLRWLLQNETPVAIVEGTTPVRIISPTTGAKSEAIPLSEVRAVGPYVVGFAPAQKPTRAVLVDPRTGARVASWRSDRQQ
jgi:hypothetical protein